MFRAYLITILLFFVFFLLYLARCFINRNRIEPSETKSNWFVLVRILVVGLMPILNIYFFMFYFYFSILADDEKFIRLINNKY